MLLEAQQHHFSAFVVKDHYCPTMLSAYIAESMWAMAAAGCSAASP